MQIVYHIGANCTDDERLLKSLLKNAEAFSKQGIRVPGPGKYRRLIRETIQNLGGADPSPDTRDILLDAILDDESATRLVMSHAAFICVVNRIFEGGQFYHLTEAKVAGLRSLFPQDEIEFHIGLRNPATFIPATFREARFEDFRTFMNGLDPRQVRWSSVIETIRRTVPEASVTVWCNEDTPLIWSQLIREVSGVDPLTQITGGFDLLSTIMSREGMQRFLSYLKSHPPQTEVQKRRIMAAFLDKYAIEAEVEEEFDLPGWTEELITELTHLYEEDMERIERMPGVTFISP